MSLSAKDLEAKGVEALSPWFVCSEVPMCLPIDTLALSGVAAPFETERTCPSLVSMGKASGFKFFHVGWEKFDGVDVLFVLEEEGSFFPITGSEGVPTVSGFIWESVGVCIDLAQGTTGESIIPCSTGTGGGTTFSLVG